MKKWLVTVLLLLSTHLYAGDIFDFSIGMSKEALLDELLSEEQGALTPLSDSIVRLAVIDSAKYKKNYFDGAIESIFFHFDEHGKLYKVRLQSSDRDRKKYMNYEYLYNTLSDKLESVASEGLVTDTYVITDAGSEEHFTSYNLDLYNEALLKEYEAYLKAQQEKIRLALERIDAALANL